jgi:hypothetical protein
MKVIVRRFITLRRALILLCFVALPVAVCAQKAKEPWSNLNFLKSGQGIEVMESSLNSHQGQFVTVTDQLLTVHESGTDVSIKREDVVRVSSSSAPRRGGHAVIGLVIGGAIGAGIGAAAGSPHGFLGGSSRGITALVGSHVCRVLAQWSMAYCVPLLRDQS